MRLSILVEPIAGGYRASTGSPLNWTAEAATVEAATAALRDRYSQLLTTGARIVDVPLTNSEPLNELAARLGQNPFMEDWTTAVSELRADRLLDSNDDANPTVNGHPKLANPSAEAVA
jgi:hypothetical protein